MAVRKPFNRSTNFTPIFTDYNSFFNFCKALSEVFVKLFLVFVKLCRTTFDYWRCPWVSHRHSIQCVQCNNVQPWACIQTGIQCWAVSVTEIIFRQLLKLTNLFTRTMKIGQWTHGKTIILFSHSVTGFSDNWVSQLVTFLEVGAFFDPCHIALCRENQSRKLIDTFPRPGSGHKDWVAISRECAG